MLLFSLALWLQSDFFLVGKNSTMRLMVKLIPTPNYREMDFKNAQTNCSEQLYICCSF